MTNLVRLSTIVLAALVSGCNLLPAAHYDGSMIPINRVAKCVEQLKETPSLPAHELDANDINIVNWNIQKGRHPDWVEDLASLSVKPDLLIMQEASPRFIAWKTLAPDHTSIFAEGFGWREATTGVMTLSSVPPLSKCSLVSHEPWFGTRKATLATVYALSDTEKTLLVVNIHGINFTVGAQALERQLSKAQTIIAAHDGPVLLAGDFNTWRGKKARLLDELVNAFELTALEFRDDHRKRVFGRYLDHIYVRDLHSISATTRKLDSSDHNPMIAHLCLMRGADSCAITR